MSDLGVGIIMKISSKVTSNQKDINNFLRRLQALEESEAQYGYFAGDKHPNNNMDMSDLVYKLNAGEGNIPPRPFMLETHKAMQRWFETSNLWKVDVWRYLCNGGGVNAVLKKVGEYGKEAIPKIIETGDWEENVKWWSEVKFKKYGESFPLIETGYMLNAAKVKVVKVNNEKT